MYRIKVKYDAKKKEKKWNVYSILNPDKVLYSMRGNEGDWITLANICCKYNAFLDMGMEDRDE